MKSTSVALCVLVPLLVPRLLAAQAAPSAPLPKGQFTMSCTQSRMSVSSNEASVEKLLEEFSKKSGITFNKYVGRVPNATLELKDATFDAFLSRVLGSYVAKSKKLNGEVVVSAVTIMDEGTPSPPGANPPPAPPPQPGEQPPAQGNVGRPEDAQAREEALKRRRRRRRRPFRGGGDAGEQAVPPGENPSPDMPPPEIPPDMRPPDAPPPEPQTDQPPASEIVPPPDQPPPVPGQDPPPQ